MGVKVNNTGGNGKEKQIILNDPEEQHTLNYQRKSIVDSLKTYVMSGHPEGVPWWVSLTLLSTAALITRLSYLSYLPGTTWDEVHFGGFASEYINKTFYHDVHPPLGKIFIAAAAYVTGYKGNFNFSAGNMYDDTIRYQLIRSEMAVFGALIVPMAFLTVYELTQSVGSSTMAGLGVLCDTFLHKINTLILLDPLLNLTICCCVFSTFRFHNFRHREFSAPWWRWLSLTGIFLGLVMSIKYIGVFTVLFVGLHTAYQLYLIACDKSLSIWYVIPHTIARALCLILLPIAIYLGGFVLHLAILSESREDTGAWLHTRFLATLNNTEFDNKTFPKYVNYGANVTIQTSSLHVGYLDSWFDLYPSELTAACQVVSTITLRDPDGTVWTIKHVDVDKGSVMDTSNPTQPPVPVRNGDWVMLTHVGTKRSLRTHNKRAPFTRRLFQVCGYGDDGVGGPFETWQIVIPGVPVGEPLEVIGHDFMLKNFRVECFLSASDVQLPSAWAHEGAKEVACSKNPNYPTLLWHINWIDTDKVIGETTKEEHVMGLWERIKQLHRTMFDINAGLKNDEDNLVDITVSSPWMWPVAYQMQLLGGYADEDDKPVDKFSVAAFNPMISYSNIISFVGFVVLTLYHFFKIMRNRGESLEDVARREQALWACLWLGLCWGIHYFPFFFMSRSLYLHHYCPAFIYSCLVSGVIINHMCEVTSETVTKKCKVAFPKKEHLLVLPATFFVVSYVCLYPLATYVEGEMFAENNTLNYYLDKLHLGQRWIQFGYQKDEYDHLSGARHTSVLIPLENTENPFVNASLYYETDLNVTMPRGVEEGQISPATASNFSIAIVNNSSSTTEEELSLSEGELSKNIAENDDGDRGGGEGEDNDQGALRSGQKVHVDEIPAEDNRLN